MTGAGSHGRSGEYGDKVAHLIRLSTSDEHQELKGPWPTV
jgi:hypothetical protein